MNTPPAFTVAIPSRYASTRLPGKPLQLIGGKPMIVHVAEAALRAGASEVVIATDDARIAEAVRMDSVTVCMTSSEHRSGSDRLAECADTLAWPDSRIVVNLQGDEPFAPSECIRQVAALLQSSGAEMATLAVPIYLPSEFNDPNTVKLVRNSKNEALYFSRAPVPWPRDLPGKVPAGALRHIGIYAYTAGFLKKFSRLPATALEICESLEQLRALENGYRIAVEPALADFPPGVDTLSDLEAANRHWLSIAERPLG